MCGIAGKVDPGAPVSPELLERMCEVIRHRGPDSRGVFLEDGVGLGVQRLAIIDLETGDQPIFNEDESVVVVLNGEIYNYRELRAELERAGHRFRTRTDTEVIVHLYEELGADCVTRLRGMFAFAVWDRPRRRLLLARDRIGKKPLFYAERDGRLWFGSEAKAILQDPQVPRDVDRLAIDAFLHYSYVPDPMSAFAALRKLPPAHVLSWRDGRVDTRRYWRLSYGDDGALANEDEAKERILESLLEATRLRLRSDVPLGAFLSGGVDSTAVVAAMAKQASGPVRTFSIGFDVESFDETGYAREVARLFGTEHEEFRVEPHAMEILPQLVWHYGEPFADRSAIPSFYLAELTRRHVTVALNGDGGDESFAGYWRYRVHAASDRFRWVPAPAARAAAWVLDATSGPASRLRAARRLRWLSHALAMAPDERYANLMASFEPAERRELYAPEFERALGENGRSAAQWVVRDVMRSSDAANEIERVMDADVNTYLPGDLLVKMDIATMAHSLEVRSPLLDQEFMQMAAGLPASAKLRGASAKRLFKDALRSWVPDHVLDRPKMGFDVPLAAWFRGELSSLPADVLLDPRTRERGLFRESAVRGLIDAHMGGRVDNSRKLWPLLQLELWFRTYIDQPVPAPLSALR